MQEWEYLVANYKQLGVSQTSFTLARINDQPPQSKPDLFLHLNELAEQGWELVALVSEEDTVEATFKRPKQ